MWSIKEHILAAIFANPLLAVIFVTALAGSLGLGFVWLHGETIEDYLWRTVQTGPN